MSHYLLNAGDVIDPQLFQGELKFLVIGGGSSVYNLLLSACGALSTTRALSLTESDLRNM